MGNGASVGQPGNSDEHERNNGDLLRKTVSTNEIPNQAPMNYTVSHTASSVSLYENETPIVDVE